MRDRPAVHSEATRSSLHALAGNCRNELVPDESVQNAQDVRAVPLEDYARLEKLTGDLLDHLVDPGD